MRRWIVCSAWPYVNTIPHLGTFIHLLSADVFSRYLRLKGDKVVSVTGSDEHGTPIEVEAIREGVNPKNITDKYHNTILDLLNKYHIEFSNYTRTENPIHVEIVQEIFQKIYQNDFIFKKYIEMPYCSECQRFLPDRFVEGICPHCGYEGARGDQCEQCGRVLEPVDLKSSRCVFCGTPPILKKSESWFFDLPRFSEKIREYLDSNPQLPDNARNFSYRWLDEGLQPRAITRENAWGIPAPFPGAEKKTIYVWLEAVLGYVSATVEWSRSKGKPDMWKDFWFNKETLNIHFIGKDNIPFHTIIFPSLLLATKDEYVLPHQVSATEFILFESQKFSKSRKIGVWVDEALRVADPEYWRFVLISMRPEVKDANFTWNDFESIINSELNDSLGNFIHRTLKFIKTRYNGEIPGLHEVEEVDNNFIKELKSLPIKVEKSMERVKLRESLHLIVELARKGNQYMSSREPWHLVKSKPEEAETTLHLCAQAVYSLAILLFPFIPEKAKQILEQLNILEVGKVRWSDSEKFNLKTGHRIGDVAPIFQKIHLNKHHQ